MAKHMIKLRILRGVAYLELFLQAVKIVTCVITSRQWGIRQTHGTGYRHTQKTR